jgi:hypothetical protein
MAQSHRVLWSMNLSFGKRKVAKRETVQCSTAVIVLFQAEASTLTQNKNCNVRQLTHKSANNRNVLQL